MKTRSIAGREVLSIGLGAMAIDEYEPKAKEEDAIELFKFAVDSGVNLIDTADVYGLGRNETLIGKALSDEQKEKNLNCNKSRLKEARRNRMGYFRKSGAYQGSHKGFLRKIRNG